MRMLTVVTAPLLTVIVLSACGGNEDSFRAEYRTKAVSECRRGAESQPNPGGVNMVQLCECMVDGYMRATPTDRLKAESDQNTPPPAANAAAQQCMRQAIQGQMGGAPAAGNTQ